MYRSYGTTGASCEKAQIYIFVVIPYYAYIYVFLVNFRDI